MLKTQAKADALWFDQEKNHVITEQPRYSAEETVHRGDEIYECWVRAEIQAGDNDKVVAIDIETSAYALDENSLAAPKRLRARLPKSGV